MRLSVRAKLLGSSAVILGFLAVSGLVSVVNLGSVNSLSASMYTDRVVPLQDLGEARAVLGDIDSQIQRAMTSATTAGFKDTTVADEKTVNDLVAKYEATFLVQAEKDGLVTFHQQWTDYQKAATAVLDGVDAGGAAGLATAKAAYYASAAPIYANVDAALKTLGTVNADEANKLGASISSAYQTGLMLVVGLTLVAILVGFALSFWLARRVVKGVTDVQTTLASLTDNCASWVEEGLGKLADNDLTYHVAPVTPPIEHFGTDEIGQTAQYTNKMRDKLVNTIAAYNAAREGLTQTVTEVQQAAESVTRTSEQLNEAATQTGAATQQVAQTISQVAGGTAEQARASSDTNEAVQELSTVITQVGMGADQASQSVGRSLEAVEAMQLALTATDKAADELKPANERAAAALDKVTSAIKENAAGMARIKGAVDESAVKVAELGAKGEQIGAIVETIDDIAEQTNLLALNAAIEAARAGEMGKGFAVVADEVRKLAERSGRATKEIASLIEEVQKGTQQAVRAMEAGAAQVEQGMAIGQRQSAAVVEVGEAAEIRNAALGRVFDALTSISNAAAQVTAASDDIARVVQQTASGAATMASSSDSVARAIQSIAAVSEENSAAAEEVSAATEEMSAQAEEVVASATTLADMAAQLDALVATFRLDGQAARQAGRVAQPPAASNVVQRRRQVDWQRKAG